MGIEEVLTAPHTPWQNPFAERFIGSARRECLDHVIVFNETGLRRLMTLYCSYHERSRTHLSLGKDTPIPRPVTPPGDGAIVAIPEVGASIIATNGARPERRSRRRRVRANRTDCQACQVKRQHAGHRTLNEGPDCRDTLTSSPPFEHERGRRARRRQCVCRRAQRTAARPASRSRRGTRSRATRLTFW